ncbi:MAG: glycosyltransferase [Candidatus Zophobacter franzmannii]|nr:glycosyltransferase [Candidatus Zophobacter franzmannii]
MKKLLYVDLPFINERGGDKNRSKFIWDSLQKQFDCSLLLIKDHHYLTKPFPKMPDGTHQLVTAKGSPSQAEAVFHYSEKQIEKFRNVLIENDFDYIFFRFTSHMELMREVSRCCPKVKVVVDVDMLFSRIANLSWEKSPSLRNRYYFLQRLKLNRFESKLFKKPYLFLFSNIVERDFVVEQYGKGLSIDNYQILPNTVKNIEIPPRKSKETSILFFGTLNSTANTDAIVHLSEDIYQHLEEYLEEKDIYINLVGKGPLDSMNVYNKKRMNLIGPVDDINQSIVDADVIILPIRIASGTRTRILEAGILGKPIVTTTIGAEGFDFSSEEIIIKDDPKEFALEVIRLLKDSKAADELGENLKNRCLEDYTWESVGEKLAKKMLETDMKQNNCRYKVGIVTNRFYPEVGGAETNIYFQAKELAERGHDVTVFCPKRIERPARELYDGINVRRMFDFFNKPVTYPNIKAGTICPELFFEILFGKHDVLMMFPAYNYNNLLAFIAGKISGKPMILCSFDYLDYATIIKEQGFIAEDQLTKKPPRFHHKFFMQNMDFIYAIANKEIELYRNYNDSVGYSPVPILLKEYEVEVENPRSKYGVGSEFVFLSLGRICNIKGQDLALKAFVSVAKELSDAKLVYVGRNDYEPEFLQDMKQIIEENGLEDRIIFTGMVEREEVLGWLRNADIHVIPVRFMNSGAVVVESWISGIPVIQSDVVDPNLVQERVNGYLFKSEDVDELSEKMKLAYSERSKLKEMAKVGERLVRERYTYEYLSELYETTFSAIVKNKKDV